MSKRTYEQNLRDAIRGHNLSYVYSSGNGVLEKKSSSDFNEKLWEYMRRVAGQRHVVLYPDFNMVAKEDKANAAELEAFIARGCKPEEKKYKHPNAGYAGNTGTRAKTPGHVPAMTDADWQRNRHWSLDTKTNRAIRKALKAQKYDGKPLPEWMTSASTTAQAHAALGLPDPLTEMYPHQEKVLDLYGQPDGFKKIHDKDAQ